MTDEVLPGGIANAGAVIRRGNHVLRPSNPHTPSIHRFLSALRRTGFDGAPDPVGVDHDGRERLVFVAGDVPCPPYPAWTQSDDALASVAALIRRFHDASARDDASGSTWSDELADPEGGAVICHNDVCLENVVFRDGVAIALLDFDFAAPGRPIRDLAHFARMCVPIDDDVNTGRLGWIAMDRPARLRVVADAYGLDARGRAELLHHVSDTIKHGGEFVQRRVEAGDPNFIKMWNEMGGIERFDRRRRWFAEHLAEFARTVR